MTINPAGRVQITPPKQLESGLLFLWDSKKYATAARFLASRYLEMPTALIEVDDWIKVYRPAVNLYCHSMELSLKAFLLSRGHLLSNLSKKPFSHDIAHAATEAESVGLVASRDTMATVAGINPDYSAYRFRYPTPGKMTIWPAKSLDSAAHELLEVVAPSVHSKARALGTPVE